MSITTDERIFEEIKLTNKLLANILITEKGNQTEKILALYGCEFSQSSIAEVLGMKLNSVTNIVSRSRKVKNAKKEVKKSILNLRKLYLLDSLKTLSRTKKEWKYIMGHHEIN